jgi:hypothetical protein
VGAVTRCSGRALLGPTLAALAVLSACGSSNSIEVIDTRAPIAAPPAARALVDSHGHTLPGGTLTILAPLGLNMHSASTTSSDVIDELAQGTELTVVAHGDGGGGWYQVRDGDQTGWISDDPTYSTATSVTPYRSDAHGFTALYPLSWTLQESPAAVVFHPRDAAGPALSVSNGPSLAALGAPGKPGYSIVSASPLEVYGVTGVLRLYDRTAAAPTPSPGQPAAFPHLAEVLVTINRTRALRIDYMYSSASGLQTFHDFHNSMVLAGAP